ncbi:MAG: NAD(P)-dependent oxidoreductase [Myxococcota bacterium]
MRLHLLHPPKPEHRAHLMAQLDPSVVVTEGKIPLEGVDLLVAGRPSQEQLEACGPSLQALIVPFAGVPLGTRTTVAAHAPQLALHNLHHNAAHVAEATLALLLAAAKGVVLMDRALRGFDWRPRYEDDNAWMLAGSTALVLGYGAIGQRVAQYTRALGMVTHATRRSIHASREVASNLTLYPANALEQLLPLARVVIICLPETAETQGLLNRERLALLPHDAVLVNIARARIVDEVALFEALRDRKLQAAALDVWYAYPKDTEGRAHTAPARQPFHTLDNVVMSPHRTGHGRGIERLRMEHLAVLVNAAARGEPMPHRVDLERGY